MELRDLIVTPLWALIILGVAYWVRPYFTDAQTRAFFLPALIVRMAGALAVGFVYQFYYNGGDTFVYHTHGSRNIWEAFMYSPVAGLKLLFAPSHSLVGETYSFASKIYFLNDPQSFFVIQVATLFDLATFSSYSATALLFAVVSFGGAWALFTAFRELYPQLSQRLAIACLFIPSVIFWGSGILKDTLTFASLGLATLQVSRIFIRREFTALGATVLLASLMVIYLVKVYILLVFLPSMVLWIFFYNFSRIRSTAVRVVSFPIVVSTALAVAFYAMLKAGEDNPKYSITNLAATARVTAYDIRFWSGRGAGSGYTLGELDGSFGSMARLAPAAINVSLFRPYPWEVRNPLMAISMVESLALIVLCVYVLARVHLRVINTWMDPTIFFCIFFALTFAFAVGVSTFNFGTLVRYKIPMLPFLVVGLLLMLDYANNPRKLAELDSVEK